MRCASPTSMPVERSSSFRRAQHPALLFQGLTDVVIALSHTDVRGWWLLFLSGIVSIALGAWAVGNPNRSVLLLVTIIGIYAIFHGVTDIMMGKGLEQARQGLLLARH